MRQLSSFLAVLIFLLLNGCSPDSNGPSTDIGTPGVGSTFRFKGVSINPDGSEDVPSTEVYTWTIAERDALHEGRRCVRITDNRGPESIFFNYPANGNIAIFGLIGQRDTGWFELPTGTMNTTVFVLEDSSGPGSYRRIRTSEYTGLGNEKMTINGTVLDVVKMIERTTSVENSEVKYDHTIYLYYSPKLGVVVKADSPPYTSGSTTSYGYRTELTSFNLK